MTPRVILGLVAVLCLVCHPAISRASPMDGVSVLASDSVLLTQSGANSTPLAIPGAGELFVSVTDLQFPTSFSALNYAVANASGTVVPMTAAGKVSTLNLTAPTTLYANVFATLGGGAGLYNLTATFVSATAVPLPGSLGCLAGAAALLMLLLRSSKARAALARAAGSGFGSAISA
jgi:hypothetical protein